MTTDLATQNGTAAKAAEMALIQGNLKDLTPEGRLDLYRRTCESLGLNPWTVPFAYLTLNGKEILYATRACTDQLAKIHSVSLSVKSRERIDDVYLVHSVATMPDGRVVEELGAVTIGNLKGDGLANAIMKAQTKAYRRAVLRICGLGMLDETEVDTIPGARRADPTDDVRPRDVDEDQPGGLDFYAVVKADLERTDSLESLAAVWTKHKTTLHSVTAAQLDVLQKLKDALKARFSAQTSQEPPPPEVAF